MQQTFHVIILAAGKGSRMNSSLPKVLHQLGGKPILEHVLVAARSLDPDQIHIVVGYQADKVKHVFQEFDVSWVHQAEQLGTGHAVQMALANIPQNAQIMVMLGDTPLITSDVLKSLKSVSQDNLGLLTTQKDQPAGYGRIIRRKDEVVAIVEEKDANSEEKKITEVNTGLMAGPYTVFQQITKIDRDNAQSEIYLTDLIEIESSQSKPIYAVLCQDDGSFSGVNTLKQLTELEQAFQSAQINRLQQAGVQFLSPENVWIQGDVECGEGVIIEQNVTLKGKVRLGSGTHIHVGSVIQDSTIGNDSEILPYSVIENADMCNKVSVGPFARIRPGTTLHDGVKIGNFVEIKQTEIHARSKVNHLSYVGDSEVGQNVNIGAGTITCNYDGANKHQTIIQDDVFVGSNTALIAPVCIEKGATIAAGSTISKNVSPGVLAIHRHPVRQIPGWKRPSKK